AGAGHRIHQGTVGSVPVRLESIARDGERLFVRTLEERITIYDATGHRLERDGATWFAHDCHWSARRKQVARGGDLAFLHGLLTREERAHGLATPMFFNADSLPEIPVRPIGCGPRHELSAARAA